tara:strand:- start:32 stop:661 length:630 start_codon:yes stop_codon:yes gene_type:complete
MIKEEIKAVLAEEDDRCTRIAKRKYDVWPSAYASGAVVKCRDGKIWKDLKEEELSDDEKKELEDILRDEGGAAGMEPFEKAVDEPAKDIKKALDDNPDVGQHEDGDYILDDGDEIKVVKEEEIEEAVYQGRTVPLNKPMRGDVKKFKVYVNSGKKDAEGRVVAKKVNFGDPNMKIKKSNPKRRKSFRARHNCDNPGPKDKARYWSCKKW